MTEYEYRVIWKRVDKADACFSHERCTSEILPTMIAVQEFMQSLADQSNTQGALEYFHIEQCVPRKWHRIVSRIRRRV